MLKIFPDEYVKHSLILLRFFQNIFIARQLTPIM